MTPEQFDQTLRELTRRRPFLPFVVELKDGREILVERPKLSFGGGVAGMLHRKEGLVDFSWEEVHAFRLAIPKETA
jgi:hypothetical protein